MNDRDVIPGQPITTMFIGILATALLLIVNASTLHAQNANRSPNASRAQNSTPQHADTTPVVPRGSIRIRWPKATRALTRGQTLTSADFVVIDTVIQWQWALPPDTTTAVAGWVTRRPFYEGEVLKKPGIQQTNVIAMGSPVKLLWQDGSIRIALQGTATNNAALGAPVGVRIDKNRRLDGIAIGPNTVRLR